MQIFKSRPVNAPRCIPKVLAAALGLGLGLAFAGSAPAKEYPTVTVVDPSPLNWLWITWNTMEEAVRVDHAGHTQPALATSWKWLNDKTLKLNLRQHVVFQDGSPFNAAAFKRSFDEVQKWEAPHPPGKFLNFSKQANMEIIDDHTIRFDIAQVDAGTMMKLRGMHIGSQRFWNQGGFETPEGSAEGNW
jgi:ABC-type transport system substrate-binding protein